MITKNLSGSTITQGYSAVLDVGANVDGVRVTQASTADLQAFIGVADKDIASTDYGLLQVYGYRTDVYIYSSTGTSAAGDTLTAVNGDWGLTPADNNADTSVKSFGFLCEAVAASSSSQYHTTAKAFIRAL
jgi:hypothetical protein